MRGTTDDPLQSDEGLPHFPNPTAHLEFYRLFKRESEEFDNDFIKKYDDEANTTLIFAGLFSAVTSAFIIDVQSQLQPDYAQMNFALLTIIASASLGKIPTGTDVAFPQWNGPDPTIVRVQVILYSSLAASLLAALIAMLGKQWLNRFAELEMHGSIADRSRDRARKFHGMVAWHFDLVMESLPLMLQAALFLLGYALSNYLFYINKAVSGVIIGFTAFGLLFYLLIVSAATLSYTCPFQTPPSLIIRYMIRFDSENWKYLERFRRWSGGFLFGVASRPRLGALPRLGYPNTFNGNETDDAFALDIVGSFDQLLPLFPKRADGDSHAFDSNCIMQIFNISTDPEVIQASMKLILEITWHGGIRITPLERVHGAMLECFDRSSGYLAVIPKLRNQAYLSARALLHLAIQRRCIGHESDEAVFESISSKHPIVGSTRYEKDSDLESTLGIIDCLFGNYGDIHCYWQTFSFSVPHQAWMGHILLYRAWDVLRKYEHFPDDLKEFVIYSLRPDPPPPAPIVTDCLFIIGLALGIRPHIDDLMVIDKSDKKKQQLNRIYKKLVETFENPTATSKEIDRALKIVELMAPLSEEDIAKKSYHLFQVVMQAPLSERYTQKRKWEASRLALHGAFKWDNDLPCVGDPSHILMFLNHYFDLATTRHGEDYDEPIQDALRALAYYPDPDIIEALELLDLTKPTFVRGICYIFRDKRQPELRKAALFFLSHISHRWFNNTDLIMEPDQMRRLCLNWASAADRIEHTEEVQKAILTVFFDIINSPHWRPHIPTEKWELLEYFMLVLDDSQPLKRCLDNPELSEAIFQEVGDQRIMTLWLKILWLKYSELTHEVREQLEEITKNFAGDTRRVNLNSCLSAMDSELDEAKSKVEDGTTSVSETSDLMAKIANLERAKAAFPDLKEVDVLSV